MRFVSEVNGISPTRGKAASKSTFSSPALAAATTTAPSVGSPAIFQPTPAAPGTRCASEAEHRGPQQTPQRFGGFHRLPLPAELAAGFVAGAGDFQILPAHENPPHGHFVFRQRAGLVGADHGGAAERFHRGKPAHQRVAFDHPLHAQRQGDRDHRRQGFRHHGHGQRDPEDDHLQQRLSAQQTEGDNHQDDHDRRLGERAAHFVQVLLERRPAGFDRIQHAGDLAELRVHPRRDHDAAAAAVGHRRPGKRDVGAIAEGRVRVGQGIRLLLDWQRLAGQRGLLGLEVDGFGQTQIGGHLVAGPQQNHIAGHEVARRDLDFLPLPQHAGQRRGQPPQRLQRAVGAVFLHESEPYGKQHDDRDGDGLNRVPQAARQHRGQQQNDDQDVLELGQQQSPGIEPRGPLQLIRSMNRQPPGRVLVIQAGRRRLQVGQRGLDRLCVVAVGR